MGFRINENDEKKLQEKNCSRKKWFKIMVKEKKRDFH